MWPFKKRIDPLIDIVANIQALKNGMELLHSESAQHNAQHNKARDRLGSNLHGRLTKLEVFFEDEIKAKEAERDIKVKEARAKALGH